MVQDQLPEVNGAQLPHLAAEGPPLIRAEAFFVLDLLFALETFTTAVHSAQTLEVERVRVDRLMNALHAHAIRSVHSIKLKRQVV